MSARAFDSGPRASSFNVQTFNTQCPFSLKFFVRASATICRDLALCSFRHYKRTSPILHSASSTPYFRILHCGYISREGFFPSTSDRHFVICWIMSKFDNTAASAMLLSRVPCMAVYGGSVLRCFGLCRTNRVYNGTFHCFVSVAGHGKPGFNGV